MSSLSFHVKAKNWDSSISGRKEERKAGRKEREWVLGIVRQTLSHHDNDLKFGFIIEILSSNEIADVILGSQHI